MGKKQVTLLPLSCRTRGEKVKTSSFRAYGIFPNVKRDFLTKVYSEMSYDPVEPYGRNTTRLNSQISIWNRVVSGVLSYYLDFTSDLYESSKKNKSIRYMNRTNALRVVKSL